MKKEKMNEVKELIDKADCIEEEIMFIRKFKSGLADRRRAVIIDKGNLCDIDDFIEIKDEDISIFDNLLSRRIVELDAIKTKFETL